MMEKCLCSSVEQGKKVLKMCLPSLGWDALKFPGFELRNFNLKTDVAMMSRRYFLLFLWTCRGLWLNLHTSEESNLHLLLRAWQNYSSKVLFVSKLKEGALPVISALLLQFYQKLFKHKGEGAMLRRGKELEQWEVRGKGAGSKRNPLYTLAAWPAFFQGSAINKAAAGSSVLLFLQTVAFSGCFIAQCQLCLGWSSKGILWSWHAGGCLGPAQFNNATPGASHFFSEVTRSCCDCNPWL